ncbi:MAG: hypothetical protein AAF620_17075, partial [Bacteroidota bacterium]
NELPFLKIPVSIENRRISQFDGVETDVDLGTYLLYVDNAEGENLYLINVALGEGKSFDNGLVTVHDLVGEYVVGYRFEDGNYQLVSEERETNPNGKTNGVECWYVDHYTCTVRVGPDDCELDYTTVHCEYYADKPPLIFGDGSGEGGGSGEGSSLTGPVQCDDGYFADEQGRCINTCGPGMVYDENEGCILLECNDGYLPSVNGGCYCPSHMEEIGEECMLKCGPGYHRTASNSCVQNEDCSTGDELINNLEAALDRIWKDSNASHTSVPMDSRIESGGWIVNDNDGYSFTPFPDTWVAEPCGINPPADWSDDIPADLVGMIHTHPFYVGENTKVPCGDEGEVSYKGGPSNPDYFFLTELMNHLGDFSVKGYVIDGNKIYSYDFTHSVGIAEYSRCGY